MKCVGELTARFLLAKTERGKARALRQLERVYRGQLYREKKGK